MALLFVAKIASGQSPILETGLYLVDDNSAYHLTFEGKSYGIAVKPISSIGEFESAAIKRGPIVNGEERYSLNFKLNPAATERLGKIMVNYPDKKFLALIIKGRVKSVAQLAFPIKNGEMNLDGSSLQSLEDIQKELKAEMR